MITCNCIVQAGQISAETEATLRSRLSEFSERHFGESADITWLAVPERSGFTAGKPSTSAVISMRPNKPIEQPVREQLLHDLCRIWTHETNSTLHEVVGVIPNPQPE